MVQTQQNRALKILYIKDYLTQTKTLHKDLELLMITDISQLYIAKFVYKQRKGLLPEPFHNLKKTTIKSIPTTDNIKSQAHWKQA